MTSPDSIDLREVIFINERCRKDYFDLPEDVCETADQAIDALQNGRQLPPKMFTKLGGGLSGIDEIRIPYDTDTYRVYVMQEWKWVIIVVGAEMKKSTSGNNIPKDQVERLEARLKKARAYVKDNSHLLERDFLKREARRNA
ncbi:MAG: type II toxin-antitoxin system RelE/ParE family toxin [Rhodospirillaceae bacterium]|nr:type II toxin-antitoxin system RelE/ParE family toxin [Rhodospirillaceae bacterium]